jgi:endogenous inhibitor of DNA gyrase (YacG/DUF329 family)
MSVTSRCATCGGAAVRATGGVANKAYPFCSARCQLIDLGRWLGEEYRVPAGPADPMAGAGDDDERRS